MHWTAAPLTPCVSPLLSTTPQQQQCLGSLDDKKLTMAIDKGFGFFDKDKSGFVEGPEAVEAAQKALSLAGGPSKVCPGGGWWQSVQHASQSQRSSSVCTHHSCACGTCAQPKTSTSCTSHRPCPARAAKLFCVSCTHTCTSLCCCTTTHPHQQKVTPEQIQTAFAKVSGPDQKLDKAEFGNLIRDLVEKAGGPKTPHAPAGPDAATAAAAPTAAAATPATAAAAAEAAPAVATQA